MLHGFNRKYICSFSGYIPMNTRYANRELNVEVEMDLFEFLFLCVLEYQEGISN